MTKTLQDNADVPEVVEGQYTQDILKNLHARLMASDPAEQALLESYRRCNTAAKVNLAQMAVLLSIAQPNLADAAPKNKKKSG